MLECAGVMAECAAVCALDIDDPDCIECMGDLYDECKDCFSTMEAIEKQAGKLQEVHSLHVAIPNKCITMSVSEKLENTAWFMLSYKNWCLIPDSHLHLPTLSMKARGMKI